MQPCPCLHPIQLQWILPLLMSSRNLPCYSQLLINMYALHPKLYNLLKCCKLLSVQQCHCTFQLKWDSSMPFLLSFGLLQRFRSLHPMPFQLQFLCVFCHLWGTKLPNLHDRNIPSRWVVPLSLPSWLLLDHEWRCWGLRLMCSQLRLVLSPLVKLHSMQKCQLPDSRLSDSKLLIKPVLAGEWIMR